jgi:CRISPR type I-F-associated protein Csy2
MSKKTILDPGEVAILIGPMTVDDVSVAGSATVIGAPQPTAMAGFSHALERHLGGVISVTGVALIATSFSVSRGSPRRPPDDPKKMAGNMDDDRRARFEGAIVIKARTDIRDDDDVAALSKRVDDFLSRARLAGGIFRDITPVFASFSSEDILIRLRLGCGNASVLRDRSDLIAGRPEGQDALDALIDALALHPVTPDDPDGASARPRFERKQPGFIVPVAVGFRAIEPVDRKRPVRRGGASVDGHQFCEEVVTLGEWISLRRASDQGFENCFWNYRVDEVAGSYLIAA